MRTPGSYVAEWVVNDPHRFTMTPNTDRAFYTMIVNFALVLAVLLVMVVIGSFA